ncbi:hypothetical protein NSA42_03075 [Paeniclostridium sordellii]|uniref:hypothetical protein n=1 Tax=Paraclostridium sordellii TaxID=1505 RepID=UPI00214A2C06|nr:hypothetical protein [Paeniclostridium sordellii]MCR1848251.1 hypothetical protein [Paeniclostridium sordellii]
MGLIKVEEILKLDRFRDLKEDGRVIEKGIIDEIIRMAYENMEQKYAYNAKKKKYEMVYGTYIRHREFKKESYLDLFFRTVEKIVKELHKGSIWDDEGKEEYLQEARVLGYISLNDLVNGKFNRTLEKKGITVNSVEDFKEILKDEEKINAMCAMMYAIIKNLLRKQLYKHDNQGYYLEYYWDEQEKKKKTRKVDKDNISFEMNAYKEDDDGKTLIDKIGEKDYYTIDGDVDDSNNLLEYLANKTNSIFMKKQRDTLSKFDEDGNYLGAFGNSNRKQVKDRMINSLDKYAKTDRMLYLNDGSYNVRDVEFIKLFEMVVLCDKRSDQFKLIAKELDNNKTLSSLIYNLGLDVYRPIIQFKNTNQINYKYLNTKFLNILYMLLNEYNNKVEDKFYIEHFDLDEDDKVKFYIDRYVMTLGLLARKDNEHEIVTVNQLREFVNNIKGFNYTKTKQLNKYLESIGYNLITEKRTSCKDNISCYKIERL